VPPRGLDEDEVVQQDARLGHVRSSVHEAGTAASAC
jgi:hypothetical protein